jgi:hypothetical protein
MRFSTGKYVVEKKLAMGQTLYESKMRPKSSCKCVRTPFPRDLASCPTYVVEILRNHRHSLVLQAAHQDQEHGLIQQRTHCNAICKPLSEYVPPIPNSDIFLDHFLVLSIILQRYALLLFSSRRHALLLHCLPARECAFQPALPVEIDRRCKHDHEGELQEQNTIKYERLGFAPCLEPLRDDVRAGIDCKGGEARDCDRRELHRDED